MLDNSFDTYYSNDTYLSDEMELIGFPTQNDLNLVHDYKSLTDVLMSDCSKGAFDRKLALAPLEWLLIDWDAMVERNKKFPFLLETPGLDNLCLEQLTTREIKKEIDREIRECREKAADPVSEGMLKVCSTEFSLIHPEVERTQLLAYRLTCCLALHLILYVMPDLMSFLKKVFSRNR
jgi:hypothetical protein